MSKLGDSFPPSFMAEFSQTRGISPGDVIYLHCPFTTPPKLKFMVVACCEPLLVLLINSEIHPFIEANQRLLSCQVDVPVLDHPFLEWDSFINCVDAHSAFNLEEVKRMLEADYGNVLKGRVADYCLREMFEAVKSSPTMKRSDKKKILTSLECFKF